MCGCCTHACDDILAISEMSKFHLSFLLTLPTYFAFSKSVSKHETILFSLSLVATVPGGLS